jgi:hypothetical protein
MSESAARSPGKHFDYNLRPHVQTAISLQVRRKSTCYLHEPGKADRQFQLDADDAGIVRFHTKLPPGVRPIRLELTCIGEDGSAEVHTVALMCDPASPATVGPRPQPIGRIIPALTGADLALPNAELIARGYPPRPDPERSPRRHARWLRAVSRGFVLAPPRKVARERGPSIAEGQALRLERPAQKPAFPDHGPSNFGIANSGTWSGAQLTDPAKQFYYIQAQWPVPMVFYQPTAPTRAEAAMWLGLDASGNDLYQAGTDSQCWSSWAIIPGPNDENTGDFADAVEIPVSISTYYAWIESLPFGAWSLPNFPLGPEETISLDIFVADANGETHFAAGPGDGTWGGLGQGNTSVWFVFGNETTGQMQTFTLPTAGETSGGLTSRGFTGSTAEFILERPQVNKVPLPLAPFGLTVMFDCAYGDSEQGDSAQFPLTPEVPVTPLNFPTQPDKSVLTYIWMWGSDLAGNPLLLTYPRTAASQDGLVLFWTWLSYGQHAEAPQIPLPGVDEG